MSFVFPPLQPTVIPVEGRAETIPVRRVFCVGRNYADHVREMGGDPNRDAPIFFTKPADAVVAQAQTIPYPPQTTDLHHEVELAVIIGLGGVDIHRDIALDHVFAYAVAVDLTRRDLQAKAKSAGAPWDMAKAFDSSCPISIATPVSLCGHPDKARISLEVNGTVRQDSDLAHQIWSVPDIIATLSSFVRLEPGDIILTGTPDGVAALKRGDHVSCRIEGLQPLAFDIM